MATWGPSVAHRRDELIARVGRAENVCELFSSASAFLRRLVPFDAAVWMATDPATGLPTAPTRSENFADRELGAEACMRLWEREFLEEDVNLYRDLARSGTPAAGLRAATRDCPTRSARFRESLRPLGFDDELRAVLRVNGSLWASVTLLRDQGRRPFDAGETRLVASLSTPLAKAVREHAQPASRLVRREDGRGPGLILFAPDGEPISINDDALAWLDELVRLDETQPEFADTTPFGVRLPLVVATTVAHARAVAERRERGAARARLRSPASGRWLVCHASCLRDRNGAIGSTALVIESANGSEIAPIVAQAYALTEREHEITVLMSRGFGTADIAGRLDLSIHTVRDYIKAIFEKAGVSSRGELVAKLFVEHYAPVHFATGGHQHDITLE